MNQLWQPPGLGYTREFNHLIFQTLEAWLRLQQANFDYQLVLLEVWLKATEEFLQMLLSLVESGDAIQQWQQLVKAWSEIFDRTFAQTFQSERPVEIRGNFVNAALTFRKQQQQVLDVFLKWNDLPSRSEVDEIHHSLYELRKEMKHLKRAFAELQTYESNEKSVKS